MNKLFKVLISNCIFILTSFSILSEDTSKNDGNNQDVFTMISTLRDKIYSAGEVSGINQNSFYYIERAAAVKVACYVASHLDAKQLIEKKNNLTPLMLAAKSGYPDVVNALMLSKLVKDHINEPDPNGFTALDYAYYAPQISSPFYNPEMALNGFAFVPYLVTLNAYTTYDENNPYIATIKNLKLAKAEGDENSFKDKIFKVMKNYSPEVKKRIMDSKDLIKTYIEIVEDPKIGLISLISPSNNNESSGKLKDDAVEIPASKVNISIFQLLTDHMKSIDPNNIFESYKTLIVTKEINFLKYVTLAKPPDMLKITKPGCATISNGRKHWLVFNDTHNVNESNYKTPVNSLREFYRNSFILSNIVYNKDQLILSDKFYKIGKSECYKFVNRYDDCEYYLDEKDYHLVETFEKHKQFYIRKESNFVYANINGVNLIKEYTVEYVRDNKAVEKFKVTLKYEFNKDIDDKEFQKPQSVKK